MIRPIWERLLIAGGHNPVLFLSRNSPEGVFQGIARIVLIFPIKLFQAETWKPRVFIDCWPMTKRRHHRFSPLGVTGSYYVGLHNYLSPPNMIHGHSSVPFSRFQRCCYNLADLLMVNSVTYMWTKLSFTANFRHVFERWPFQQYECLCAY